MMMGLKNFYRLGCKHKRVFLKDDILYRKQYSWDESDETSPFFHQEILRNVARCVRAITLIVVELDDMNK